MSSINKARKALQALHREFLEWAISCECTEYVEVMNRMFDLLKNLESLDQDE